MPEPQILNVTVDELQKAKEDDAIVKYVCSATSQAEAYRAKFSSNWKDFIAKYLGQYYRNMGKQKPRFDVRGYHHAQFVEMFAALMTQQQPKGYIVRVDEDKNDLMATVITRTLADVKTKAFYEEKEWTCLLDSAKLGVGIVKVWMNRDADDGRGYPDITTVKPENFYVAPGSSSLSTTPYCGFKRAVATAELRRLYPKLADKIKTDSEISSASMTFELDLQQKLQVSDPINNTLTVLGASGAGSPEKLVGQQTWLNEFYFRDTTTITLTDEMQLDAYIMSNPGYGVTPSYRKLAKEKLGKRGFPLNVLKYPHGRRIMVASNQKLDDGPVPYPRFPFFGYQCFFDGYEFYGQGVLERSSDPIAAMHLAESTAGANTVFTNMPLIATDDPTLDDTTFLTKNPGELVRIAPGRSIRPLEMGRVAKEDTLRWISFCENLIENTTFLRSQMLGEKPTGTYSARLFSEMVEASLGALLPQLRRLNRFRTEVNDFMVWMIQNYIRDERLIVYMNEDDKADFVTVNKRVVDTEAAEGEEDIIRVEKNLGDGIFKFRVELGEGMPVNKMSRFNMSMDMGRMLSEAGAPEMGVELVLENSQFPGWKELIKKFRKEVQRKMKASAKGFEEQKAMEDQKTKTDLMVEKAKLDTKIEVQRLKNKGLAERALEGVDDTEEVMKVVAAAMEKLMDAGVGPDQLIEFLQSFGDSQKPMEQVPDYGPSGLDAPIGPMPAEGEIPPGPMDQMGVQPTV